MSNVTVYSTQACQYCRMAKAFLDKHGVPYESIDVGSDQAEAEKMIELSGQRGVPVIVVDDEVIVGFDSQRLNELFGDAAPEDVNDVVIVGAGPAGLTAGVVLRPEDAEDGHHQREHRGPGTGVVGDRELHGLPDGHGRGADEEVRGAGPDPEYPARTGPGERHHERGQPVHRKDRFRMSRSGQRPSSSRRATARENSVLQTRSSTLAAGSRSARPATGRSTGARKWRWWAAGTRHSRPQSR